MSRALIAVSLLLGVGILGLRPAHADTATGPAHRPHPRFSGLADSSAIDLGHFSCSGPDEACARVTDYSGVAYDRRNHRLMLFGGGHASTMSDTVFALELSVGAELSWTQSYPPTPCAVMIGENLEPGLGAWKSGPAGPYPRPLAAHTYDLVAFAPTQNELVLLGRLFTAGRCSAVGNNVRGPVAHFAIDRGTWEFSADGRSRDLQDRMPAGEYDPVSDRFVILGRNGLHLYDPASRTVAAQVRRLRNRTGGWAKAPGYANQLTYFPPTDTFYYFKRGAPATVYALKLDREQPARSTLDVVATSGPSSPHGEPGYDYDSRNRIIGGGIFDNVFFAFDPASRSWTGHPIVGGSPGNQAYHAIAYDPVNNVFVFITRKRHTWAYRLRN